MNGKEEMTENFCEKSVGKVILNTGNLEEILNMVLREINCEDV
jgi:hypothetical protein